MSFDRITAIDIEHTEHHRKKPNEDSPASANSSASWKSRNEPARRSSGSTEQPTKFNDKRNPNDDRFGSPFRIDLAMIAILR